GRRGGGGGGRGGGRGGRGRGGRGGPPPVQRAQADLGMAQVPPDPRQRPGPRPLQQRGDPAGQPPPAQPGRPQRGRSASLASPSVLNRPIQRRTVAGWHSSSTAIWAAGNPCSDSSTITPRAASPPRPPRLARTSPTSLP